MKKEPKVDLRKALQVAIDAAQSSGRILIQKFKKINFIRHKGPDIQDYVTEVDLESEKNIQRTILKAFPNHSVLAEESGLIDHGSDYLWVIDPLCGTANFINQIDLFVISIALVLRKQPVLAVVYDPMRKDLYCAVLNQGVCFNEEKVRVSDVNTLGRAMIALTLGKTKKKRKNWLPCIGGLITSCYKLREFGSTALNAALLVTGRIDGCIGLPRVWDVAASVVLTQEAGGKVTDWQGKDWSLKSKSFLATNGKIHDQLIKILRKNAL